MLSVEAREAANIIFQVFDMIQLRIKLSLPCFAVERSNHKATKLAQLLACCGFYTVLQQEKQLDNRM